MVAALEAKATGVGPVGVASTTPSPSRQPCPMREEPLQKHKVTSCKLRATSYELQATSYELRATGSPPVREEPRRPSIRWRARRTAACLSCCSRRRLHPPRSPTSERSPRACGADDLTERELGPDCRGRTGRTFFTSESRSRDPRCRACACAMCHGQFSHSPTLALYLSIQGVCALCACACACA